MAEPVNAPFSNTEPVASDLQTRIDDLRLELRDWRRSREYSKPTQERLEQITLQCARLVESWQQMERRRTGNGASLEEKGGNGAVDRALTSGAGDRIRELEQAIEQEWDSLPQDADEATRQFSVQLASLAENCVTAANLALRGFANAEARLTTIERDIRTDMAQLSRDLKSVLTELRSARSHTLPGAPTPFPLEGVMRIHQELRESQTTPKGEAPALETPAPRALPQAAESATALVARVESLERTVESVASATPAAMGGWTPKFVVAALVVALGGIAMFGLWLQRRVDTRLSEAALQVTAAERQRDATVSATREEAARQVSDARASAAQAQIVANVLAAPDLVRYWLTGAGTDSRAYAHVLFSRTRGLVFSASRLPAAADGKTYQLWLLTRGGAVNAGLMNSDAEGRATLASDVPITVAARITGAMVTLEPAGGRTAPSGDQVMVRVE